MNYKNKRWLVIVYILVCVVLASFAANSYAKYIFSSSERLEGQYTDFRLTHDGNNKSVILEEISGNANYTHEGYVTINLRNEDSEGELSQRNILFNIIPASLEQIAAGKIVDSWGEETKLLEDNDNHGNFVGYFSDYYDLTIINAQGNAMTNQFDETGRPKDGSALYSQNFLLAEPENPDALVKSTSIMLKVQRRKITRSTAKLDLSSQVAVPDLSTNSVESLDMVLKTFIPYIDLRVLQLNLTSSLIYVSSIEEDYFSTPELNINIKTSINYSMKVLETSGENEVTNTYNSYLPVKMVFTFDSRKLIFDYERFRLSTRDNYKKLSDAEVDSYQIGYHYVMDGDMKTLTLFIPAASDLDLYFYLMDDTGCKVNLTATTFKYFDTSSNAKIYDYLSEVSGIESTGNPRVVYSN